MLEPTTKHVRKDRRVTRIPGVKLDIGIGAELIISFPGIRHGYKGRIIGFERYQYLIASVRIPSDIRSQLKANSAVIVKYIHDGTVFGFRTDVLNHIITPAQLLFLTFPDQAEKLDLRKSSRAHCNIEGALYCYDEAHECLVVDVSGTGCRIAFSPKARDRLCQVEPGTTLVVNMMLGATGALKQPIMVKNIKRDKGTITLGCMFLDINSEEAVLISNYMDKINKLRI